MTTDRRAALVEKVARVLRGFYSDEPIAVCDGAAFKAATAAIALIRAEVLEEAARVAETVGPVVVQQCEDGKTIVNTWRAFEIAAAIRALKTRA